MAEAQFVAPCEACGRRKEGNYTKYSFLGYELMVMLCIDCDLIIRIAGVANMKADIDAFREQLGKRRREDLKEPK